MSFDEAELTRDGFLGGRVTLWQPRKGYRAATDPVWLAAACPARTGERVLELGCGAGAALACLNARVPGLALTGVEIQESYAALARRNLPEGTRVICGDLARMPVALRAEQFDHVIANPPFFDATGSVRPSDAGRDRAHVEETPLSTWIDAGLRRLRERGTLTMIHRVERLGDILAAIGARGGAVRILPLSSRAGRAAERVIVQTRKGARTPLALLPPLIVHEGDRHPGDRAHFTPVAEGVLRMGDALPLAAV